MMKFILQFLPSFAPALGPLLNPWVLLAFVVYSVALLGFGAAKGYDVGVSKLHQHIAKQAQEAVKIIERVQVLKETVRVPYLKRETEIVNVYHYIEKEAEHVPSRAACNVTAGWMRVHDAAAAGDDRRIEGAVDDASDTGIKEARAVALIASNYQAFHQVANDLKGCRGFVEGLHAALKPR